MPRAEAYLHAKFDLDPSNRLAGTLGPGFEDFGLGLDLVLATLALAL